MNNTIINNFSKWLKLIDVPHELINQNFTIGVADFQLNIRPNFKISGRDKYILIIPDNQIDQDIFYEEFKNSFGDLYIIKISDIKGIMQLANKVEFKKLLDI